MRNFGFRKKSQNFLPLLLLNIYEKSDTFFAMFFGKKSFSLCFIFLFFASILFAQNLTEAENNLIQKTLDARLKTRLYQNEDDAIEYMKDFRKSLEASGELENISEQAVLIIDNMINIEIYNYMYQKDMYSDSLKSFITTQYNKIVDFQKKESESEYSPWFYFSSGDIINSSMQFLSQGTAIKLGLQEKDDYDEVLTANPTLSFGLINAALWYFFAPAIGGGSKKTAFSYFERSLKSATSDYEKFYSRIYLSQIFFEDNDFEACENLLKECDEILPENVYTSFIRFLNKNNYSLLCYTNNREKVEKKLGIQK